LDEVAYYAGLYSTRYAVVAMPKLRREVLVKMRVATEEDVLQALGRQLGIAYLAELKPDDVDAELAQPRKIRRKGGKVARGGVLADVDLIDDSMLDPAGRADGHLRAAGHRTLRGAAHQRSQDQRQTSRE